MSLRDSLVDALDVVAGAEEVLGNAAWGPIPPQVAALRAALAVTAPLLRILANALREQTVTNITRIEALDLGALEQAAKDYENRKFSPKG